MMKIKLRRTKAKSPDGIKKDGMVQGRKYEDEQLQGEKENGKEAGKKRDKSDGKKAEIGWVCYAGVQALPELLTPILGLSALRTHLKFRKGLKEKAFPYT